MMLPKTFELLVNHTGGSDFGSALWRLYDATGIRPEWLVPVLYSESGLDPSRPNSQGYPYYGLNQISGDTLDRMGISPDDYLTWSQAQQLDTVVTPYMHGQVQTYGPLQSGTRVYQANFMPATLKTARSLTSVIAPKTHDCDGSLTSDVYCANLVFDYARKGSIQVADLAHYVSKSAANAYVQQVLADAYSIRPREKMTDPVYGKDFATWPSVLTKGALGLAGVAIGITAARFAMSRTNP